MPNDKQSSTAANVGRIPPVLKTSRIVDFVHAIDERTSTGTISIAEAMDLLVDVMAWDDVIRLRDAAINLQQFCEWRLLARNEPVR